MSDSQIYVLECWEDHKLNGLNEVHVYADGVYLQGKYINTIKNNSWILLHASKKFVNIFETKYMHVTQNQNQQNCHNITVCMSNKLF